MSCVLRAVGVDFDVDAFLQESSLNPCAIFRRGEPRSPSAQANGPRHQQSSFNVEVSAAEFNNFEQQSREALQFLRGHQAEIERLAEFGGVEGVELDFAADRNNEKFVESYVFAPELLTLVGKLGLRLSLSCYNQLSSSAADDQEAFAHDEGVD